MIDLKEIKDISGVKLAFRLTEPLEFVGELKDGKESLERIKLVLNQTFDALDMTPFRQLIISGEEDKVMVMYYKNEELGILFSDSMEVEEIKRLIYEKAEGVEKKEEVEVEEKESTAEEEVAAEEEVTAEEEVEAEEEILLGEEVEVEEEVPEKVEIEKELISPHIIERIEEISTKFLGDFSLDIVSNVIEDCELDKDNPTRDQILEITHELKNAASLIIGPSKAGELEDEIKRVIKEEG